MLGGLALKWRWRERMRKQGKPTHRPNLVMGINVQVCWRSSAATGMWRRARSHGRGTLHLGAEEAVALCDENTIGVVAILGSTFDGSYEPVKEISAALDRLERDRGLYVPIHVDAPKISLDRLVAAVEGRAEDRHHADRVLVAQCDGLLGAQMEAVPLHRDPGAPPHPSSGTTSPSTPGR